jgi:hypothetical protein
MLSRQECYEKVVLVIWSGTLIVLVATPSNCGKLLSDVLYRPNTERFGWWHHRETCGYGKNQNGRDNPQPSPNVGRQRMQFRDSMSVGVKAPKIESVRSEMRPNEESSSAPYTAGGEQWEAVLTNTVWSYVSIQQLNLIRSQNKIKKYKKKL